MITEWYIEKGGQCTTIEEGVLGFGTIVLHSAPNLKSIVIREYYLNPWSSGHTIKSYKVLPKKYQQKINELC